MKQQASMCPRPPHSSSSSADTDQPHDWRAEAIAGGSLRHVDLETGTNGWASPPGPFFSVRSRNYFSPGARRPKSPSDDCILLPAGMDWLRSPSRLDNVLGRPDNRLATALRTGAASPKTFLVAVNLQIPGREHHSAVFYFAATEDRPIPAGSTLARFVHGPLDGSDDPDAYRNARFKLLSRIVRGPWIVRKAVGGHAACLLGKALRCEYHRGERYLEIDVDIGSSAIANAILRVALGCASAVTIDMGFLVEAQTEEELPERLFGAVRVAQMDMAAATYVDDAVSSTATAVAPAFAGLKAGGGGGVGGGGGFRGGFVGSSKVADHREEDDDEEEEWVDC